MKEWPKVALIVICCAIVVTLLLLVFINRQTFIKTDTRNIAKYGEVIEAYHYRNIWEGKKYVLVLERDSVITEIEVTAGVFYVYYNGREHEGHIFN